MKTNKFIFIIIIFVAIFSFGCNKKDFSYPLISLEPHSHIKGSFILGCGTIGINEYFFVYVKIGDKIIPKKLPLHRCAIIEGYKNPKLEFTAWVSNGNIVDSGCIDYNICVPEGTLIKRFDFNFTK